MAEFTNSLTPIERFFKLLAPTKKAVIHLYIFAAISGVIALSLPLGVQAIINLIQGGEISASWIVLVSIVVLGYTFNGILQVIQMRITEDLQKDIFTRSSFEFAYRIPRIKMKELYHHYAPELMNRFFDTISVQKGISKILVDFSTSALQIVFGMLLLSFYHPFFILFSVLIVLTVYILGRYIFTKGLKSSLIESKYKYTVAHWLEELARTNNTFRLDCASNLPLYRTDKHVSAYIEAREVHFGFLLKQYYIFIILKVLIATGFLLVGGLLVINQQMNIGQFVAAEIVIILLIGSLEKLLMIFETIYDILTSLEKLGQVTDLELESDEGSVSLQDSIDENGFKIDIDSVFFKYPDSKDYIIYDLNLKMTPGQKICITGPNGSGKSTLFDLLTALYPTESGTISYNDLPLNNYQIKEIRSMISDCVPSQLIFDGTLKENITLGRNYPLSEIQTVLKNVKLTDFVKELSDGIDTIIGPQGKKLSKGISQKIILARNIIKKPRLFLIEDFFSGITKEEKEDIMKFLIRKDQPWSLILITKDIDMLNLFDNILYMEKGQFIGSPDNYTP